MQLRSAIDTFVAAFGIGTTEATVYVHLCLGGPAKVGDLAAALKMHRNEVYRSTGRLVHRGLVEMTLERPARFAAVPPRQAFDAEIAARLGSISELRHMRDEVVPLLVTRETRATPEARITYKVIQGRREVFAARNHMIENAASSIDWATTFPGAVQLADVAGALDAMTRRLEEGVKLRALVGRNADRERILSRLEGRRGVDIREFDVESTIRFLIVDGKELLMWVVNDESPSLDARAEVAIQTTAPGFVQAEAMFFEQAWGRARPRVGIPSSPPPRLDRRERARGGVPAPDADGLVP